MKHLTILKGNDDDEDDNKLGFPTCGYKRVADYEIEVYPPGDSSSDDYTCEIWIPIVEK